MSLFGVISATLMLVVIVNGLNKQEFIKIQHHNSFLNDYPCRVPQPRVMALHELRGLPDHVKEIKPHATVLHKCDGASGCCPPKQVCRPKTVEQVKLYFGVQHVGKAPTLVTIHETNHTECNCQPAKNRPK